MKGDRERGEGWEGRERERQRVRERDEIDRVRDRKREEWDTEGYRSTESVIDTGCEAEY